MKNYPLIVGRIATIAVHTIFNVRYITINTTDEEKDYFLIDPDSRVNLYLFKA
jgi:hypothetical protein